MIKIRKSANNQVIHKIIHIIHKDNDVDEWIYINKNKHMFCIKIINMQKQEKNTKKLLTILNSKNRQIQHKIDVIQTITDKKSENKR